jgi:hypothetical protein
MRQAVLVRVTATIVVTAVMSGAAAGCGARAGGPATGSSPPSASGSSTSPSSFGSSTSTSRPGPGPEPIAPGTACGALGCRLFDTPEQAFAEVLRTSPRVIALGESHAQKGTDGVRSTTVRFTDQLLPLLKGRASDLVLELIVADGSCGKKTESKVAEQQKPVTEPQRDTNQSEFLALGNRAKELGIRPHVLRPSCPEYERIAAAGDDAVPTMLGMIADETVRLVGAILDRNQRSGVEASVLAYGGAMHNDLSPRSGTEGFSYASRVSELVQGRYVEVDLIVPEFIRDTETWRALPWYPHFDRHSHPDKVTLLQPGPRSYVIVFAASHG